MQEFMQRCQVLLLYFSTAGKRINNTGSTCFIRSEKAIQEQNSVHLEFFLITFALNCNKQTCFALNIPNRIILCAFSLVLDIEGIAYKPQNWFCKHNTR